MVQLMLVHNIRGEGSELGVPGERGSLAGELAADEVRVQKAVIRGAVLAPIVLDF